MTDETVIIENLPDVKDINVLIMAMESIGVVVTHIDRHTVKINASMIHDHTIDNSYIKKIRASYYMLGALLGKYRDAEVALPGGCNIGSRPIDQHLKAFSSLGAKNELQNGEVHCFADDLIGSQIYFDINTVFADDQKTLIVNSINGKVYQNDQEISNYGIRAPFRINVLGCVKNETKQKFTSVLTYLKQIFAVFQEIFEELRAAFSGLFG